MKSEMKFLLTELKDIFQLIKKEKTKNEKTISFFIYFPNFKKYIMMI